MKSSGSLALLLEAAAYLERKERADQSYGTTPFLEMEHGYASTAPMPEDYHIKTPRSPSRHSLSSSPNSSTGIIKHQRRTRNKPKLHTSRTTHNELEKNRRAHLRVCLEKLKELVPVGPDGSRHTTLGLLKRAKYFIKNLEDKDKKQLTQKDFLEKERRHLRRQLSQIEEKLDTAYKRRSVSESSTFSSESSSSGSSYSESDEVDILGYHSNQSDTDDHSSVQSSSSERGVIQSTRRLTIDESSTLAEL